MSDTIALVTGGSSGIGLAIAASLIDDGWRVVITGRRKAPLDEACLTLGARATGYAVDANDAVAMVQAVASIEADLGPITALVANAGTNVGRRAWGEVSPEDFASVVQTNLNGAFNVISACLPGMRERNFGRIVVVSSFAGWHVTPQPGPAYTASKMAVRGLVQSLNMAELRHGIRATALCPGEVATPAMQRRDPPPSPENLARMLQPQDVAAAVSYIINQPDRVNINEIVITPFLNNSYLRTS